MSVAYTMIARRSYRICMVVRQQYETGLKVGLGHPLLVYGLIRHPTKTLGLN